MYRRDDPRIRRTINQLSQNLESANESAQANLYTFGQRYINPCFSSIGNCAGACTAPCFPNRDERRRRHRAQSRGRAELSFDFYDDWEEDENDGLLGWGNDELDRLLAGSGGHVGSTQPGRQRAMSYGTRRERTRRKSAVQPHDGGPDPTIIPNTSYFGFLGRLPWKIGGRGLKYKPSAADLQEHPGASRRAEVEEEPLIEESEGDDVSAKRGHMRNRSLTNTSGHTTDSLSSRGDIFPSEDELDDAVPLDDEFAMALERRATSDENSSGPTRSGKRPSAGSRMSTRTVSSRSTSGRGSATPQSRRTASGTAGVPTLSDLKLEEERTQKEEEENVKRKRDAARRLALERGLKTDMSSSSPAESKSETSRMASPPKTPMAEAHIPPSPAADVPTEDILSPPIAVPLETEGDACTDTMRSPLDETPSTNFVPAQLPSFHAKPD